MAYKEESEGWGGRGALHARYPVPAGRGAPLPPRRALHASPTDSLIRLRAVQGVLTLGAIGWGAYQLASKIRQKVGEGNKLGSKAVVKEIAITTVTSSISFLTGGVADALPDLFGVAEGVSEAVSKGTQFGTAEGLNMAGEPQSMNIGAAFNVLELFRDLAECCSLTTRKCKCPDSASALGKAKIDGATVSVNNRGAIDDLTKPAGTPDLIYTTSGSVTDENGEERGFVMLDDFSLSAVV